MQSLLLLVAPALFAASIYIILGRIILLVHGERYSLIRRTWLTKVFVAGDVLSFMVQGAGGGIQAGGTVSSLQLGEKIILSGLFLQLAFFGFFIVVVALFHRRLVRANTPPTPSHAFSMSNQHMASTSTTINIYDLPWKRHLYALYAASTLIVIRSIFRVIEYLQGNTGYLLRYEVFLYVFDAALMLGVMVLFNWVHPSQVTDVYQRRKREQVVWT
ncbi:putative RTA1 domain protein [Pleomassaria siparia CBS 279.74]|uniref:Putative RTA1 domain protein n=1 Tax=Pleomassaria siparia CBS 279.74 TaxID=1314801 RepID=A0A6G1K7Z6_9PLEO|nr:putative RTA1 domain protein [Pleomassaria siparia CBS 279.74]